MAAKAMALKSPPRHVLVLSLHIVALGTPYAFIGCQVVNLSQIFDALRSCGVPAYRLFLRLVPYHPAR